jgi:hypothetical protein
MEAGIKLMKGELEEGQVEVDQAMNYRHYFPRFNSDLLAGMTLKQTARARSKLDNNKIKSIISIND